MTKYLAKMEMQQIMEHVEHRYEEGRSAAAPKLAKKTDTINNVDLDNGGNQELQNERGSDRNRTSSAI